jgi:ribose-phosphate pyrophosphokinase
MSNFSLDLLREKIEYHKQEVKVFEFPGGEVSVKLPERLVEAPESYRTITVHAQITDSMGVMSLLLINNAINHLNVRDYRKELVITYVPYARQDRVCNPGEALSIQVMAQLINSMNFDVVLITDPHSDVTPALINNVVVMHQDYLIDFIPAITKRLYNNTLALVSPDAGAVKKAQAIATKYCADLIYASKKRNVLTGELTGFSYEGNVEGKDLLIVDDICDGGGTFLGLSSVLKRGGANTVSLFVTHGIFSKGIDTLLNTDTIDTIYTTDSYPTDFEHPNFFKLKL